MDRLVSLLTGKRANCSRGLQKALREIDTIILARVMNSLPRDCQVVLTRNMSRKARDWLMKEMQIQIQFRKTAYNDDYHELPNDVMKVCKAIETFTNENFDEVQKFPEYDGELAFETRKGTIDSLYGISEFARGNGLLALEGLGEKTNNRLFRKALELLLLGIEPFRFEELLDNYRKQFLKEADEVHAMIVAGIRGIYDGDHPDVIKEKLESLTGMG
jgi:hypothetical protein